MSVIAAALRELMAAGLDGEELVGAIERIESAQKPVRSSGADRQARYRARKDAQKAEAVTGDVTSVTNVTSDDPLPPCPPSFPPNPLTTPLNPPSPCRAESDFDRFWKAYPRRDGANPKKPAKAKFERHVKRGADPEAMIAAAEQYRLELERDGKNGTQFVAQAQTWLNQERWDVDPPEEDEPDYPAMASMLRNPDVDVSELLAIKQSQGNAAAEQFAKQFQQPETVQ